MADGMRDARGEVVDVAAGYDPANEFTFGLDLILDALERPAPPPTS